MEQHTHPESDTIRREVMEDRVARRRTKKTRIWWYGMFFATKRLLSWKASILR